VTKLPCGIYDLVTLGELIAFLAAEAEADPTRVMRMGLSHPHPWRGIHAHLAFEVATTTVAEALEVARRAVGTTWYDNVYTEETPVYFAKDGYTHGPFRVERNCFGEVDATETAAITGARLRLMMGDELTDADREEAYA